jgi:hypothetical protein
MLADQRAYLWVIIGVCCLSSCHLLSVVLPTPFCSFQSPTHPTLLTPVHSSLRPAVVSRLG